MIFCAPQDINHIKKLIESIEICQKNTRTPSYIKRTLDNYHLIYHKDMERYSHGEKRILINKLIFVSFIDDEGDEGKQFPNFFVAFYHNGRLM